jgi:segregation and condensation protein A
MPFEADLPGFHGPLEDLVRLVVRSEIEICSVPLTELARQLAAYCREQARENIDQQAEWLDLVARLILWKSRQLLGNVGAAGTPDRRDLLENLLSLEAIRAAAAELEVRARMQATSFAQGFGSGEPPYLTIYDLLQQVRWLCEDAAQAKRNRRQVLIEIRPGETTVGQMQAWLEARLAHSPRLEGTALLAEQANPDHRNCLFLAMLDLARQGGAGLDQPQHFGPFWIERELATK